MAYESYQYTPRKRTEQEEVAKGTVSKGGILARFDGECPYPCCPMHGVILGGAHLITKGPLGWGHAGCVNTKVHLHRESGGGHPACATKTQWARVTNDKSEVTCKKCLKILEEMV